jgi:hypothetical protein
VNLPVTLAVSSPEGHQGEVRGKAFRCLSQDVSLTGIRIKVQDQALWVDLPLGCELHLGISFPPPCDAISCFGILKSKEKQQGGTNLGYLNVKFANFPETMRDRLKELLRDHG